jgi:hypothetical protein
MIVKNRRGISTFIATLLLMVLAVAAGVVIYAYTMGYLGGFGGPQTLGSISIDTYNIPTDISVDVYVRNIGKTTFVLQNAYFDGTPVTSFTPTAYQQVENEAKLYTITTGSIGATTHTIKLIGVDNTQISFNIKK